MVAGNELVEGQGHDMQTAILDALAKANPHQTNQAEPSWKIQVVEWGAVERGGFVGGKYIWVKAKLI